MHLLNDWKDRKTWGETKLFSVSGSLPWPGICLGNVVFEVMLISQEKVSLLVYSNMKTCTFTAAIVIYVKTADNCAWQIHTLWQCAYHADIGELISDIDWHNWNKLFNQFNLPFYWTYNLKQNPCVYDPITRWFLFLCYIDHFLKLKWNIFAKYFGFFFKINEYKWVNTL